MSQAHLFPFPEDLVRLHDEELKSFGFSRQKARAILELADSVFQQRIDLEALSGLKNEDALERLLTLKGVGRWTAEYGLLRGLGRLEVFPGDDAGARRKLRNWLHLPNPPSYPEMQEISKPWHPYAGLVYFHLLLSGLAEKGFIGHG